MLLIQYQGNMNQPFKNKKLFFYSRLKDKKLFELVDFYSNDIRIFHELGFEVVVSNSTKNIPDNCDIYFIHTPSGVNDTTAPTG